MIFLDRFRSNEEGTFGMLVYEGEPLCFTCELPWKENKRKISCIPTGVYKCSSYSSIKFPKAWAVAGVPNRDNILIHQGNTIKDLLGCICVGDRIGEVDGLPAVLNSKKTMLMLKSKLPDIFKLEITGINL